MGNLSLLHMYVPFTELFSACCPSNLHIHKTFSTFTSYYSTDLSIPMKMHNNLRNELGESFGLCQFMKSCRNRNYNARVNASRRRRKNGIRFPRFGKKGKKEMRSGKGQISIVQFLPIKRFRVISPRQRTNLIRFITFLMTYRSFRTDCDMNCFPIARTFHSRENRRLFPRNPFIAEAKVVAVLTNVIIQFPGYETM